MRSKQGSGQRAEQTYLQACIVHKYASLSGTFPLNALRAILLSLHLLPRCMLSTRVREPMRDLFRRASFLFWQYPSLWLPVALADLLAYGLSVLYSQTLHWLMFSLFAQQSVLSSIPDTVAFPSGVWTIIFIILRITTTLLGTAAYAAALLVVSVCLSARLEGHSVPFRRILTCIISRLSAILLLAVAVCGACAVAMAVTIPLYTLPNRFGTAVLRPLLSNRDYSYGLSGIVLVAVAWSIAPVAFIVLKPASPNGIGRLYARNTASLCVAASSALFLLSQKAQSSFLQPSTPAALHYAYWIISSSVAAVPYTFLFIALHVLARPESAQSISLEPLPLASQPSPLPPSTAE